MLVLGIETSCDETAAAVIRGRRVLSDVVHSQIRLHAEYGGVVPELASRDHLQNLRPVVERALEQAGVRFADLDALAVTCRPGLTGALLVGTQFAKAVAWAADKPLVGVDHLIGHLLAAFLEFPGAEHEAETPSFPFVGLVASGGHTALYRVDGPLPEQIRELGSTRDDAAGEAFDKVAKLLGLGYPGGPIVDRLAQEGDASRVELSAPLPQRSSLEFSFSGLKTNVMRFVAERGLPDNDQTLRDLCAAFQTRVVESLVKKAHAALEQEGLDTVVLGGGVAANSALRSFGTRYFAERGRRLVVPSFRASTDNAAMIAYAGSFLAERGVDEKRALVTHPKSVIPKVTKKGGGPR